ncbi:MAG: hypothetical protein NVS2B7_07230 [Herpetosiphon sp.]
MQRSGRLLRGISVLLALAACSGPNAANHSEPAGGQPGRSTASTAVSSVRATAQVPPTAGVSTTAMSERQPTSMATTGSAPTNATPLTTEDPLAGIPQGTTAEGYHTLGVDGAPVTMTMFSDFL